MRSKLSRPMPEMGPIHSRYLSKSTVAKVAQGILPESPEFLAMAKTIDASANATLTGVLTHAGHSYGCKTTEEIKAVAEQERLAITGAAQRLRNEGLPAPLSAQARHQPPYTRKTLKELPKCGRACSCSTILSNFRSAPAIAMDWRSLCSQPSSDTTGTRGHIILDAGALALSKDISAHDDHPEVGYGEVCDVESLDAFEDLYVNAVSQEHGIVPVVGAGQFDALPIGTKVRILPNHACITAAGYTHYEVLEGGAITERWDRVNGW